MNELFFMIDDPNPIHEVLAANLRRLRIARHLSLSELARATGMSKATLSGIENGRANPTVETLSTVAAALRVSLGELLEEAALDDVKVVRAARGIYDARNGIPHRLLEAVPAGGALEVAEIALDARRAHEAAAKAPGSRAHLYVIAGKLLAGPVERVTELGPGDYASFPSDVPHVYEAGTRPARALLVAQSA
jgi:transcriptional regulator with XRE-family HTH domain